MGNKAILGKTIAKAIKGGWKPVVDGEVIGVSDNQFSKELHLAHKAPWNNNRFALGQSVASMLIDHDFAKALWGEKTLAVGLAGQYPSNEDLMWQYHLQRMVIADDPINYLGENI